MHSLDRESEYTPSKPLIFLYCKCIISWYFTVWSYSYIAEIVLNSIYLTVNQGNENIYVINNILFKLFKNNKKCVLYGIYIFFFKNVPNLFNLTSSGSHSIALTIWSAHLCSFFHSSACFWDVETMTADIT